MSKLPKGFTLRTQAGSTFLEIDLSHFSHDGIRSIAEDLSKIHGYAQKPRREAWKGRHRHRHQHSGQHANARPRASVTA